MQNPQFHSRPVLFCKVLILQWTPDLHVNDMQYTMVEFFSGKANVAGCFRNDPKHKVATFEKEDSPSMDFLSQGGFALLSSTTNLDNCRHGLNSPIGIPVVPRLALVLLLKSAPGAVHLFAPVCSSWTRVSRGTSARTCLNWFGDLSLEWVTSSNTMISRQGVAFCENL